MSNEGSNTVHQAKYILSIQSEYQHWGPPVFRGMLETVAGQKFEFSTLDELNRLLYEVGGWIDSPTSANEGGEANAPCQAIDAEKCDDDSYKSGGSPDLNPKKEEK
ncbi:MAG: hypothetical protein ACM3S0_05550 [Acidobacteriota bacterium]